MTPPSLPAFGWQEHSEQISAAALAARAWRMNTTMFGGRVYTALLEQPEPQYVARLEAIAEHQRVCQRPDCGIGRIGHKGFAISLLCPNGKFDPTVTVFATAGFDAAGQELRELYALTTTPEEAVKNHYAACTLIAGALASWNHIEGKPA